MASNAPPVWIELKKLNWLPFSDRLTCLRATLMFKCFNNAAPTYLFDKFHKLRDLHNNYTRQATADLLALPKFKLDTAQNSFSFKGAKLWNSLPISIKSSTSLSSFKRNVLKHLRNPVKNLLFNPIQFLSILFLFISSISTTPIVQITFLLFYLL